MDVVSVSEETVLRLGVVSFLSERVWGSNCQGLAGSKKPSAEMNDSALFRICQGPGGEQSWPFLSPAVWPDVFGMRLIKILI